jgi:phosphoenolpyruvate phosphomutase
MFSQFPHLRNPEYMKAKTTQLKEMLCSPDLSFLMEAHNGLSAKIVEEAGFRGIWASGLSISAALGVRDNNEASWTQVLEVVEFMADGTAVPILLDGDTGYGNFNNLRRLINKLEQRGVAGVCIEDKLFPKTNSFIDSEKQPLADMGEFCGKIKAAKDTQRDDDFCVVARVEALIAGWGVRETLTRAEAYRLAGADAILVHSKRADASEIEAFMKEWGARLPVVIVPTKYYSTPTQVFREIGVRTVIWANHNCRAAITAMQQISRKIFEDQSLINVEGSIATVQEVFRMQGEEELREAEAAYLPSAGRVTNSIILAASRGTELGALTEVIPKTLLTIGGKSILARQIDEMRSLGIKGINVVCGYGKDMIQLQDVKKIENDRFATTSDLYSLYCARDHLSGDVIVSYGDIVFKQYVLHILLSDEHEVAIIVDSDASKAGRALDLVKTSASYEQGFFTDSGQVVRIWSTDVRTEEQRPEADGEFIGLWKISASAMQDVVRVMDVWHSEGVLEKRTIVDLLNHLAAQRTVAVRYIKGSWLDIDTIVDLQRLDMMSL